MLKLYRSTAAFLSIFTFTSSSYAIDNINDPVGEAVSIISQVPDNSHVKYYNANYWRSNEEEVQNENKLPSLAELRQQVIEQEKRILIDFSQISDDQIRADMHGNVRKTYGVGFSNNFIIISKHKGELLFTSFDKPDKIDLTLLDAPKDTHLKTSEKSDPEIKALDGKETKTLPHIAFYLNVNRVISDDECTFVNSSLWKKKGTRPFCQDAHISLIYRVNLMRSLQYGVVGSATPNAKIVRISLDDESTGAGIHLNDKLNYQVSEFLNSKPNSYFREWSTDAVAQDYRFNFNTSNDKAQVLKTIPANNINADYEHREISEFELGISAEGEVDKKGPKAKLEASASYKQSRWLTYKTKDYGIERSTKNDQNVSFMWNREQYATAASLLNRKTDAIWVNTYPVDVNRINPISFASFVPKVDVIYKASPKEVGTTDFKIDSSVNIRPIYNAAYSHYYVIGGHQSYHGFENNIRRRVNKLASFTVDWDHPVFTGGQPVNLQLASFNNRCIEVANDGTLSANNCNNQASQQSFIYDQLGRYVSAAEPELCLDGESLTALKPCNQNLSQRWEWKGDSDELTNVYTREVLGHDTKSGTLGLYVTGNEGVSLHTITSYTDLFTQPATINSATDKQGFVESLR